MVLPPRASFGATCRARPVDDLWPRRLGSPGRARAPPKALIRTARWGPPTARLCLHTSLGQRL